MKNIIKLAYLILIPINLFAQATSLPLLQISDLQYEGAFAIPADNNGVLGANYSAGTITYNSTNGSIFLAGHQNGAAVGEYSIPSLVNSTDVAALNSATILQDFRQVLQYTIGDYVEINLISGMAMVNDKLIINAVEYYDADANNLHTGVVLQTPTDIANSSVDAYYSLEGAAHTSGWLSPIPAEWQTLLGGDYIAGNSSKYSINSRLAIGISAFAFNASDMTNAAPGTVATTTLLDFDLSNPLYADYANYENSNYNLVEINGDNSFTGHTFADANATVGTNDLWTEISQASYGFIIPGTSTYMAIGASGGHGMGIGYKPTQSDGNVCGGPCPYDADDRYNYYWLWDVNDLLAVKNGTLNPHDVRPYDYGVFDVPFQTDIYTQTPEFHEILGGTYDADNEILYLAIDDGASTGQYEHVPVIAAYSIGSSSCPTAGTPCNDDDPNTENDVEDGFCNCSGMPISSSNCEILTNTNFDTDLTAWLNWGCTAEAVGGIANLTNMAANTTNIWEIAFIQPDVPIEQGEDYEIKFSARADANRALHVLVQLDGSPYTNYYNTSVNLTTTMQDYTLNFTMNEATDFNANFMFYMGGNDINTYIANASLEKVNCETTPPPTVQCECPDIPENGNVVTVQNVTELQNAISQANSQNGNMTIKVEPGVYQLSNGFVISPNMSNLTVMGTSGNRDDVFIKGQGYNGGVTAIFLVQADNFSVAHLTLGEVSTHGIQVQSEQDADDFTAVNVRFVDINEQFLKVSGGGSGSSFFSDRGRVLCCEFEFTAGIGYQYYTGGIDAHRSKDWIVHNNVFKGIRSPEYLLAEHAIHFWQVCEGTIVTSNQIDNCDRGIGFGLGDNVNNGHVGGLIMNNFVHTNRDVGIGLEHSPDTKVYNNTVITDNYPRSIEYRFPATTDVQITNNLVNGEIAERDNASATLTTNYTVANTSIFVNAANYDYHLTGTPTGIVDAGTLLSEVNVDIDCENRIGGAGMDIGADEVGVSATCPPVEILTGNTTINVTHHAAQTISSDATINADVIYKAGDEIELKSGFSANPVNNFTGEIEDCDGN